MSLACPKHRARLIALIERGFVLYGPVVMILVVSLLPVWDVWFAEDIQRILNWVFLGGLVVTYRFFDHWARHLRYYLDARRTCDTCQRRHPAETP